MPAKNTTLLSGKRHNPLNQKLWKRFKKDTGIEVEYNTFKEVIWETSALMAKTILEGDSPVKLPANLGYIVVTKYKTTKQLPDWFNTNRIGKPVPLLNLHSLGYVFHIKWFRMGVTSRRVELFKFKGIRPLTRSVAKAIKGGRNYHKWDNTDFWSATKMERTFEKRFKKQQREDNE